MQSVTPEQAAALVQQGAVLIDVCEAGEFASDHIAGARHHALSRLHTPIPAQPGEKAVIFYCASGMRTRMQAPRLMEAAGQREVYVLSGGLAAWRRAGLPTHRNPAGQTPAQSGGLLSKLGGLFR